MFTPALFNGLANYAKMVTDDHLVFQAFKVTMIRPMSNWWPRSRPSWRGCRRTWATRLTLLRRQMVILSDRQDVQPSV